MSSFTIYSLIMKYKINKEKLIFLLAEANLGILQSMGDGMATRATQGRRWDSRIGMPNKGCLGRQTFRNNVFNKNFLVALLFLL